MFKQAREKDIQDGYEFKKGYSRVISSSSGSDEKTTSGKEAEKELKRKRMDAEEQQKNITNIKALLESINEHIRIKQLRIQKLKTCTDLQQCDISSKETTELLTQKLEYVPPPTESKINTTITEDMDSSEPSSQMLVIDIASQTINVSSLAVVHSDSSADRVIIDSDQVF